MTNFEMVKEFHEKFNHANPSQPQLPSEDLYNLRRELIREEFAELDVAYNNKDLIGMADALGDMLYVVYGAAVALGLPMNEIFREIHTSNMSKLDSNGNPIYREDGKVLKGPNFKSPDLRKFFNDKI